jgi:LysR family transcriptional activator of nhaA
MLATSLQNINLHHLRYFWAAAKWGGVVRASEWLKVAQPSVSAQIRELESTIGEALLERKGRGVVPTETGRRVFEHADRIFTNCAELIAELSGETAPSLRVFAVGVTEAIPKLVAHQLLAPVLRLRGADNEAMAIVCREGSPQSLLPALLSHDLDLLLADTPQPPAEGAAVYSHLLGKSPVAFFGKPELLARKRKGHPGLFATLAGAPLLLPGRQNAMRRALDHAFEKAGFTPRIRGEFDDSALMKVFGQHGAGLFPAPEALAKQIWKQHGVRPVLRLDVIERFFAITVERKLKHPAATAMLERAETLFA